MTPEAELQQRCQDLHDQALTIRNNAERAGRNLTAAEVETLDQIFADFDRAECELKMARYNQLDGTPGTGRRRTEPDNPADRGDIMASTPWLGRARQPLADAPEVYALPDGTKIQAYRPDERLSERPAPPFNLARCMAAIRSGNWTHAQPEMQIMAQQHSMLGSSGGFMVPEMTSREIIDLARAQSRAVQAGVRTLQMPEATIKVARVANDLTPYWRQELEGITSSSVTFEQVVLSAKTVGAICSASNELLQDGVNTDGLLRRLLAEALAGEIDRVTFAGVPGSPSPVEPTGIVTDSNVVHAPAVGTISSYRPVVDALSVLWAANGTPDTIVHNVGAAHSFAALQDTTGQPMTQPRAVAELRELVSNRIPDTGSPAGHTSILGGFSEVVLGVRLPLELAIATTGDTDESGFDAFSRYETRFRAVMRVDVAIFRPSLLYVLDDIRAPAEVTGG